MNKKYANSKINKKHSSSDANKKQVIVFIQTLKSLIEEFMHNQNTLEATINTLSTKNKKAFKAGTVYKIKSTKDKNTLFMIYKQRIQILQKILLYINTYKSSLFTKQKHIKKITKLYQIYSDILKTSITTIKFLMPKNKTTENYKTKSVKNK